MKVREFTLILSRDPTEEQVDQLFGTFDGGTISTILGVPQIHFRRKSRSLEEANRRALRDVRSCGFDVNRLEMLPDALPA